MNGAAAICEHSWHEVWHESFRRCTKCKHPQWYFGCLREYRDDIPANAMGTFRKHEFKDQGMFLHVSDCSTKTGKLVYNKAENQPEDARVKLVEEGEDIAHLMRQLEIIPMEILKTPVTIVGAGAIGSFVALSLIKMGFANLTVFDDDEIDIVNLNCQFYPKRAVGKGKVDTLNALLDDFSGTRAIAHKARFTAETPPARGIVISAVDSMAARKMLWERHKGNAETQWFIDPRMGAEYALMYVMNPNDLKDQEHYEKTLYSDEKAVQERCTAKATIYTALLLSGMVCKAVKDALTLSPDRARIMDWNIGANVMKVYK